MIIKAHKVLMILWLIPTLILLLSLSLSSNDLIFGKEVKTLLSKNEHSLRPAEKLLYLTLTNYGLARISISQAQLAEETSLSISSIKRALKSLMEKKMIKVVSGKDFGLPNTYIFNDSEDQSSESISNNPFTSLPEGIKLEAFEPPSPENKYPRAVLSFRYLYFNEFERLYFQLWTNIVAGKKGKILNRREDRRVLEMFGIS